VYGADWTPTLLSDFETRRGYKLEEHFPELLAREPQVLCDYRETLGEMLLHNFTEQWTAWAHSHGAITRNQAHGSPANLIDLYAAVDIPEIEGFGLTDFHLPGLRTDSGKTRHNFSDLSMLKYAPSAAHITGKRYTSSETFTWLTEHFRTSLSQMKPDLDLMFCAGVNHVYYHGTCYSPKDDVWPGWKFYASIDMSPTNSIWRDATSLNEYIERCQSFLQWGEPDNDLLVHLPVRDSWRMPNKGALLMQFDIHAMSEKAPQFIRSVLQIDSLGFGSDYISDKYLLTTRYVDGMLQTAAGTRYRGLIIPSSTSLTPVVKAHVDSLAAQGAKVTYGIDAKQLGTMAKAEEMKLRLGLSMIRRSNDRGHHYFIANLTPQAVDDYVRLAIDYEDAIWFNPLNGERYAADIDTEGRVRVSLQPGESMILETFDEKLPTTLAKRRTVLDGTKEIKLDQSWTLTFVDSHPAVAAIFALDHPRTWEGLDDDSVKVTMGTGSYSTTFNMPGKRSKTFQEATKETYRIVLGDVRESARVYVNDSLIGCAWAVPFQLTFSGSLLQPGSNTLRIEVTNLPANRIADLDRKGYKWRKFNEINVVDINYKKTSYADWTPVPSGLASLPRIYACKE